jgi:hypothetical protein
MLEKYYLNTLSGDAYNAYYAIDSAVRSYRPDCMLYGIGTEEADLVVKCYMYDNPDVWHCNLYLVRVGSEASGTRVFFNYNDYNASDFNDKLRQITDYVDSHTDNYSSDYDIVKTVYDYFTKNMRANDDAQCAFGRLDTSNDGAIGEFVEKYGYSLIFQGIAQFFLPRKNHAKRHYTSLTIIIHYIIIYVGNVAVKQFSYGKRLFLEIFPYFLRSFYANRQIFENIAYFEAPYRRPRSMFGR